MRTLSPSALVPALLGSLALQASRLLVLRVSLGPQAKWETPEKMVPRARTTRWKVPRGKREKRVQLGPLVHLEKLGLRLLLLLPPPLRPPPPLYRCPRPHLRRLMSPRSLGRKNLVMSVVSSCRVVWC